jgi:endonuclease/exonuclease/phosphatase family metal-dependent hydrolase
VRITQLAEAQPDVTLLQEVNPLPAMAHDYVEALEQQGLHYAGVHQVDACGLRLAPGLAILPGLNNGLAILAKAPLTIRKLDGPKLSGPLGGCVDYAGVQFGELRYALLAEVTAPPTSMTYLVATMHLHSDVARDAKVLHDLMEAHSQGHLQHYDQLWLKWCTFKVRFRDSGEFPGGWRSFP